MALAYNHEEIAPRELKPVLLELDGISRETIEAHYKLYQGYVNKRNEILGKLADVDLSTREPGLLGPPGAEGRPHLRDRGIKNHEVYFEHLGGNGGDPAGVFARSRRARLRLGRGLEGRSEGDGLAARGWAWTAYDFDEGRLFNYIGDAQNTFPVWNASPLVALDVYEHAYFLDYRPIVPRTSTRSSTTSTTTS